MKQWFSVAELVGVVGLPNTPQNITARARREAWQSRERAGRGGGREYHITSLPPVTQAALLLSQPVLALPLPPAAQNAATAGTLPPPVAAPIPYDAEALWRVHARKSQKAKDRAAARVAAVDTALALIAHGTPRKVAFREAAGAAAMSLATLYRAYEQVLPFRRADWPAALVDRRPGRTARADCSVEAWDFFKADYLRPEKPAASAVYDRLKRAAGEHGWTIPAHVSTLVRRLNQELSRAAILRARHGVDALKRSYPAQERDRSVFAALEAVNVDGHRFDVFVKWPDGEIARPTMVCWQDVYSGKLLAWRCDKTENTDAVRLSFGDLVEAFGIPSACYLDNGRSFASKWLTGGMPNRYRFKVKDEEPAGILTLLLGADNVHWATPYHGQAKPIERAFRDLCEYVAKHPAFAGAYVGNNPTAKPENYGSRAVPLDEFLKITEQEIAAHNAREGRRGSTVNGRSFDAVFNESYANAPVRKATAEQRRLWLLAAEGVTVKHDGTVTLEAERRNRYFSAALHDHAGKTVVVRFDPQALHDLVHVYTLDGRYLCEAACIEAAGFNDTQAARDHSRARNQFKRAARAQLDAEVRMDVIDAARLLPTVEAADPPDARIVRPVRPAIDLRPLPRPTLTDQQQRDIASFDNIVELPSRTLTIEHFERMNDGDRLSVWRELRTRVRAGETLRGDELTIFTAFGASDTIAALLEMERDFGVA